MLQLFVVIYAPRTASRHAETQVIVEQWRLILKQPTRASRPSAALRKFFDMSLGSMMRAGIPTVFTLVVVGMCGAGVAGPASVSPSPSSDSYEFVRRDHLGPVGFAFRQPRENAVFDWNQDVPIALAIDERIWTTVMMKGGNGGENPPLGYHQIELAWSESSDPQAGIWTTIPLGDYSSNPTQGQMSNGHVNRLGNSLAIVWEPGNGSGLGDHEGTTYLRARVYNTGDLGQGGAEMVNEFVSEPFYMLPKPDVFVDNSSESQIEFGGKTPYSILALNYDEGQPTDQGMDFLVSYVGDEDVQVYRNNTSPLDGHATFLDRTLQDAPPLGPARQKDARGLSLARFDDSLAPVVVSASPLPASAGPSYGTRVYALEDRGSGPKFYEDITIDGILVPTRSLFPATDSNGEDLFAHVWAASWGKINPDDNGMAVYLARSEYVDAQDGSGVPTPTEIAGKGKLDLLLRWNPNTKQFVDLTATALAYGGSTNPSETIAATWARLTGDDLADIFVSHLGPLDLQASPGWSVLYKNAGDGTFTDASGPGTGTPFDPTLVR